MTRPDNSIDGMINVLAVSTLFNLILTPLTLVVQRGLVRRDREAEPTAAPTA